MLLAGASEVAEQEPLDGAPDECGAGQPPGGARPPVERLFELPRRPVERAELGVERGAVRRERRGATGQEVEDRRRGEARRDEALVHAVPRDGVDQPGGVPDEERALARDRRSGPA